MYELWIRDGSYWLAVALLTATSRRSAVKKAGPVLNYLKNRLYRTVHYGQWKVVKCEGPYLPIYTEICPAFECRLNPGALRDV